MRVQELSPELPQRSETIVSCKEQSSSGTGFPFNRWIAVVDLVDEDPESAIGLYFDPVGLQPLPHRDLVADDCSTDGYYDPFVDPTRPWIFYAQDVAPSRVRFTLLHELGHHLFNTSAAWLLDDLDRLGGSSERAKRIEETVCHQFASELLLPTELVDEILPSNGAVLPAHVRELHERANTVSLDAVAVLAAGRLYAPGAVVIMRDEATRSFCAARGLEDSWWPRGSVVDPVDPLPERSAFSKRHASTPTDGNSRTPGNSTATRFPCTIDSPSRSSRRSRATEV